MLKHLFSVLILLISTNFALAQQIACGLKTDVLSHLSIEYKEVPADMGLNSSGNVTLVLVSPKGTWTILLVSPNGVTCIVAVGESWVSLDDKGPKL